MNTRRLSRRCAVLACCWIAVALATLARADGHPWDVEPGRQVVSIGHAAVLRSGESASDVVAVFGSSTAEGDVTDSVVAVFGDARVTGTVGNNAVAVLGNVYINGKVTGNVVDVLGSITLGPQAQVSGRVVEVLGALEKSESATVEGGIERVLSLGVVGLSGFPAWVRHCLLYGRLLAFNPEVSWAWGLALAALGFYVLLAALFGNAVERCVRTLETHPGASILTVLVATLLSPVVYLVLLVTIVGIALIPLVWTGLLCASVFGKGVALAWLGERCLHRSRASPSPRGRIVLEVLVGGLIMLALYLIPIVGFAAFTLFGLLGLGAVLYTLVLAMSEGRPGKAPPAAAFAGASAAAGADARMAGTASAGAREGGGAGTGGAGTGAAGLGSAASAPGSAAAEIAADESTLPRAGFWIRIGALAIDVLLVGIVLGLLHNGFRIELVILAAYGVIMWKLKGTTIGGTVCDLKVARVDGRPIDWGTAIVRALGCFLSLAIAGLGFVWIALDPQRQAWHDKIAGTVVVRVPKGVPLL
ncbi:MAG: RDD family protein [Steroidobacteraceae bacterium]